MDISVETIPGFIIRMNSSLLTIQVPKSVTDIYLHVNANQKFLKHKKSTCVYLILLLNLNRPLNLTFI